MNGPTAITASPPSSRAALPTLHIRPARGWLNDPNGIVHHAGRWHVFYQHNPAAARHENIHWGHVSSPDLVTWTEHPVAFGPQPGGPDRGGCWSGVFMPWGDRPAVAYSGIGEGAADSTVCVRYASDPALERWSDPVVVATAPETAEIVAMRDPFVFEWAGRRYGIIGAGLREGTPAVLLYSCDDPLEWQFERVWLTPGDPVLADSASAGLWECPQLVEIDQAWVLVLSLWVEGAPDRVVHAVGDLVADETGLPRFVPRAAGSVDEGDLFYAPQVVAEDASGRQDPQTPLMIGWVRQDDAPHDASADAVSGCLSLPRRLSLADGDRLVSTLDPALRAVVGDRVEIVDGHLPGLALVSLTLDSDAAGKVSLVGTEGPLDVSVESPTEIWMDGEVVEVYAAGRPPLTARQPGTDAWRLSAQGVTVTVRELVPPNRG